MMSINETAAQTIQSNAGLNRFMNRVYAWSGLQMVAGLGLAYGLSKVEWFQERPMTCVIVGGLSTIVGFVGAKFIAPIDASYEKDGKLVRNTRNKPSRLALYLLGSLGLGLTVTPLVLEANLRSPDIIPSALAITGSLLGGASLVAYSLPKRKLFSYRHVLQSALLGLLGLEVIGFFASLIWGNNYFIRALNTTQNFLGIGVFTLYMMFDTHMAIENYENGYADHLGVSIQFLLNAWNIFVRVVEIMNGRRRRNDD